MYLYYRTNGHLHIKFFNANEIFINLIFVYRVIYNKVTRKTGGRRQSRKTKNEREPKARDMRSNLKWEDYLMSQTTITLLFLAFAIISFILERNYYDT